MSESAETNGPPAVEADTTAQETSLLANSASNANMDTEEAEPAQSASQPEPETTVPPVEIPIAAVKQEETVPIQTPQSPVSARIASITGIPATTSLPASLPAIPQTRLPPSQTIFKPAANPAEALSRMSHVGPAKITVMKNRIDEDPKDGEAWQNYLTLTEERGDLEKTRQVYEELLKVFPDSVCFVLSACIATSNADSYRLLALSFRRIIGSHTRILSKSTLTSLK